MLFEWGPASLAHVGKHGLSPAEVEAIFGADDFDADPIADTHRMLGYGTVSGQLYLVVFKVDSRDIIGIVTAYRVKRRKRP